MFSDSWFDLHGNQPVTVTVPKEGALAEMTEEDFRRQLRITHYGETVVREEA